jgi:ABC-type transport system involved in multi-copper enzyme maturation permease subunit
MQTAAILLDSWRLLMSRKLFWITLAINLLIVLVYGSIGFTPTGVSIGFGLWTIESDVYRLGAPIAKDLYTGILSAVIVSLWLSWVAVALGLVSTASIFPDFLADGAVDMVLARPLSRTKVFLVKYLGSLLFALLQVAVFCVGSFLCLGLRLDRWEWGFFVAIPLVVLVYSYLYCIVALVGVLTRSAIAAILVTGLFWLLLFAVSSGEQIAQRFRVGYEIQLERIEATLDRRQQRLDALAAEGKTSANSDEYERFRGLVQVSMEAREDVSANLATATSWHNAFWWTYTGLPKTQATTALLQRAINYETNQSLTGIFTDMQRQSLDRELGPANAIDDDGDAPTGNDPADRRRRRLEERRQELSIEERMAELERARSAWWVIGTSLGFQIVVLGLAAWVFSRKDF